MRTTFAHVSKLTCTAALLMGIILSQGPVRAEAAAALRPAATIQDLINGTPEGGTVQIPAGSYTESLTINKRLTLSGPAPAQGAATITAVTGSRVITVSDGKDLTLVNLTLTGGQASGGGGAVYVKNSNLTIEACILWGNQASYGGGVFLETSGTMTVTDSSILNNQASIDGGGIYSAGPVTLTNVKLNNNVAGQDGGGVSVWAGKFSATAGEIKDNQAGRNGGGANVNDSVYVHGTWISGNKSGNDGGGILQWNGSNGSTVVIEETLFWSNTAVIHGGGLAVDHGAETTINHSVFLQNTVDSKNETQAKGGGVYFSEESTLSTNSILIVRTDFEENKSKCGTNCPGSIGGGVYAYVNLPGLLKLTEDTFHANDAWFGGGVYSNHNQIMHAQFNQNTGGYGAGGYLWGSSFVQDCTFDQNKATNRGGGLDVTPASSGISIYYTKFTGNIGGYVGGGAFEVDAMSAVLGGVAVANTRVGDGSAININNASATLNIDHFTVSGTTTSTGRAGGIYIEAAKTVNFKNTLIALNGVGIKTDACTTCLMDHTLFYDNTADKAGLVTIPSQNDLSGNPLLGPDGFHLASTLSAAINAGTPTTAAQDIDGDTLDSLPDVGADEYRTHTFVPTVRK